MSPEPFYAIGQWYLDFAQTSDSEVVTLLGEARGFGRSDLATADGVSDESAPNRSDADPK
jgi:hypothetical protein